MAMNTRALYTIPGKVVVTAHRGFSGQYPENTLPAFRAAVDIGADIIEFDLRGTKDGVPIVLHDISFERTANMPGGPQDYCLAEIKRFEASYWHGSHEVGVKLAEPELPGTRIPTFEDVLTGVPDTVGLNIQVYDTSPKVLGEICRLYRDHNLYSRGYLTMSGFDEARAVRRIDPDIALCVTDRGRRLDMAVLKEHKAFGCQYVQPLRGDVTRELCAATREMGLCANMFFSNTDADNRHYVGLDIPGILTDHADVLIGTLRSLGRL